MLTVICDSENKRKAANDNHPGLTEAGVEFVKSNRRLCTRFDPDFVLASNLSANLEM